jgi:hypothetical protein
MYVCTVTHWPYSLDERSAPPMTQGYEPKMSLRAPDHCGCSDARGDKPRWLGDTLGNAAPRDSVPLMIGS